MTIIELLFRYPISLHSRHVAGDYSMYSRLLMGHLFASSGANMCTRTIANYENTTNLSKSQSEGVCPEIEQGFYI